MNGLIRPDSLPSSTGASRSSGDFSPDGLPQNHLQSDFLLHNNNNLSESSVPNNIRRPIRGARSRQGHRQRGRSHNALVGEALSDAIQEVRGLRDGAICAQSEMDHDVKLREEIAERGKIVLEYKDQLVNYLSNFPFKEKDAVKRLNARRQVKSNLHRVFGKKLHLRPEDVATDFNREYRNALENYREDVKATLEESRHIYAISDALDGVYTDGGIISWRYPLIISLFLLFLGYCHHPLWFLGFFVYCVWVSLSSGGATEKDNVYNELRESLEPTWNCSKFNLKRHRVYPAEAGSTL